MNLTLREVTDPSDLEKDRKYLIYVDSWYDYVLTIYDGEIFWKDESRDTPTYTLDEIETVYELPN